MVCQCFSSLSLPFSFSLLLGVFAKPCFVWQNLFISLSVPWQLQSSYSQDAPGVTFCNSPAKRETTWNLKKQHVNASKCSMQHSKSNHQLKQASFKMGRQSLNHLCLNDTQVSLWKQLLQHAYTYVMTFPCQWELISGGSVATSNLRFWYEARGKPNISNVLYMKPGQEISIFMSCVL